MFYFYGQIVGLAGGAYSCLAIDGTTTPPPSAGNETTSLWQWLPTFPLDQFVPANQGYFYAGQCVGEFTNGFYVCIAPYPAGGTMIAPPTVRFQSTDLWHFSLGAS
jgi:hypothetical protein